MMQNGPGAVAAGPNWLANITMLTLMLVLAITRLQADQIRGGPLRPGTAITLDQVAKVREQTAGNVIYVPILMTDADSGEVTETSVVLIYPPAVWCTGEAPQICP